MNAAIKLLAFVGQSAQRVLDIVVQREPSTGDLIAARRIIIGTRADLDEADQRLRAEISRRVQRPNPLLPDHAAVTDREVDDYEAKLRAGTACVVPPTVHESASPFVGVESPERPILDVSDRPRRAPGRYAWDHHARRLIAAGGSLQLTRRPVA
jgi:hypothetical protein